MIERSLSIVLISLLMSLTLSSQNVNEVKTDSIRSVVKSNFKYKQLVIPTVLIGYGVWATDNDQLEFINFKLNQNLTLDIDDKITMDDFSQYAPLVATLSLETLGIKSKNNFKDKVVISATAYLIMGIAVNSIKQVAHVQRPDMANSKSFPSGHTATAFMGAELLHQEYKNVSLFYSFSGYFVAAGTGVFRMYNNRHWFSDVVTGAGIGILSAKAGYWLYPTVKNIFKHKKNKGKTVFVPYYDGKNTGFGLISTF